MSTWYEKAVELIQQAEIEFLMPKSGEEKKAFVVNALNTLIDIPFVPEFLEAKLLDAAIDGLVYVFNTYIWKKQPVETTV
jgi:hypothetical protein